MPERGVALNFQTRRVISKYELRQDVTQVELVYCMVATTVYETEKTPGEDVSRTNSDFGV